MKRLYNEPKLRVSIGFLGELVKKNPIDSRDFRDYEAIQKGELLMNEKWFRVFIGQFAAIGRIAGNSLALLKVFGL